MTKNNFQGVKLRQGQTCFSVYAPKAEKVELCLFSDDEIYEHRVAMVLDDEGCWHADFPENMEGRKYGYRTHGEYNPDKLRFFNPSKLLIDPYALELTRSLYRLSNYEKEVLSSDNFVDSSFVAPKGIVRFLNRGDLERRFPFLYRKPRIKWENNHIYEFHVDNFTRYHPDISMYERGRLPAVSRLVPYFQAMSYNQLELMPLTPTMGDWQLEDEKGLLDQWGYNPVNHHAIDPRYGSIYDFLDVVNHLHEAGIEVSLDMVFNHTGEFGKDAFLLSYKGFDGEAYYRAHADSHRSFVNTTGCKNGFNPNTEQGGRIIRDSMMFFADICGVDAFRLDLAGDCALDDNLQFSPDGKFMQIIEEVIRQTGVKVSGEPWSAVGGYFLGRMKKIYEWNDKHEKALKKFIRGEYGQVGSLAYYMAGGETENKINIFTKHDGATQYDWASYSQKNNYENNENNRDGSNDNHYSPSADDAERLTKTKTAHALNTLARGVPLSLSGDELWHTQNGNNNGYAKQFPLQWRNFSPAQRERYLFERKINAFRQKHPLFSSTQNASAEIMPNGRPSWEWVNIAGEPMRQNDWDFPYNRFLGYVLNGQNKDGKRFDDDFLILASGNVDGEMIVKLPPLPHRGSWELVFDTSCHTGRKNTRKYEPGEEYVIKPYSTVVMINRRPRPLQNIVRQMRCQKSYG